MERKYAKSLLEKTKQDYNLIAKDFSRTRSYPWQEIKFLFNAYLSQNEKVLDLGCGNGRYFPFFREKQAEYFGVDNSAELIKIAKNKYPEARFSVEDALNLSFPNNFFDKVYNIAVLHQIPSEEFRTRLLQEIKRTLKFKGLLILTVWKFHRWEELSLLLKYIILKIIGKSKLDWGDVFIPWGRKTERYYHCFSKKELEGLIKKVGFKLVDSGIAKDKKGNRQNIYIVAQKYLGE
ncbi:MAG: class I SAM-dependent methyltransferase [Candidatus Nealsonbacteria bacterium]|nr:MAG: class I SAM-dependent methyltransferase [Candidatus Nealsonbacteria bacterium]